MKISMTNLVGPSIPIRLGEKALSKSIMFMNYFRLPYIQFYVFTHCDIDRLNSFGSLGAMKNKLVLIISNLNLPMLLHTAMKLSWAT